MLSAVAMNVNLVFTQSSVSERFLQVKPRTFRENTIQPHSPSTVDCHWRGLDLNKSKPSEKTDTTGLLVLRALISPSL